jgi:hypothetical protein
MWSHVFLKSKSAPLFRLTPPPDLLLLPIT